MDRIEFLEFFGARFGGLLKPKFPKNVENSSLPKEMKSKFQMAFTFPEFYEGESGFTVGQYIIGKMSYVIFEQHEKRSQFPGAEFFPPQEIIKVESSSWFFKKNITLQPDNVSIFKGILFIELYLSSRYDDQLRLIRILIYNAKKYISKFLSNEPAVYHVNFVISNFFMPLPFVKETNPPYKFVFQMGDVHGLEKCTIFTGYKKFYRTLMMAQFIYSCSVIFSMYNLDTFGTTYNLWTFDIEKEIMYWWMLPEAHPDWTKLKKKMRSNHLSIE